MVNEMDGKKYYQYYQDIYSAALAAGVDNYNNPPLTDFDMMFNRSLLPSDGNVLDLGCGEGLYSLLFAAEGYQVQGIDISPSAIKWAQLRATDSHLDNTSFIVGDVTQLTGLSDSFFDVVLSVHCYHCLSNIADRFVHLQEAMRVLKPGGVFFFDNMAAPLPHDMPQFRSWHNTRGGKIVEDESGVTTTVDSTPSYTIQRWAGSEAVKFQIGNAVAMAHRFYSRLDHAIDQLEQVGFEIVSAEFREPDPTKIPETMFVQGDNVIYARKAFPSEQE